MGIASEVDPISHSPHGTDWSQFINRSTGPLKLGTDDHKIHVLIITQCLVDRSILYVVPLV